MGSGRRTGVEEGVEVKGPPEDLELDGGVAGLEGLDGGVEAALGNVAPGAEHVDVDFYADEDALCGV